jgi:uncharacterized RDD family membrane protein YckC
MARTLYGGEDATFTRRFFGDNVLEGILQILTLGVGWLIWLAIVSRKGQTPAKQLLNIRIHDYRTGRTASATQVWIREVGVKVLLPLGVGLALWGSSSLEACNAFSSFYTLVVGVALLSSAERRAVWDHVSGTVVRYHPKGVAVPPNHEMLRETDAKYLERRLQELELLRSRGVLNADEYRVRRAQIIGET